MIEVEKAPPNGGKIIWEWHLWDHLIQDHEAERRNFGSVADHPELVDINGDRTPRKMTEDHVDRLKALGYVVGAVSAGNLAADLVHANSIAHHPTLDQIALSAHNFGEIWIIDHSTTTIEAAGHTGGWARRGGDLLYRWGNPQAHRRGAANNRRLFGHHDVRWIPRGLPGEGNIMIFNNGSGGPGRDRSTVLEIRPPVDEDGTYASSPSLAFAPERPVWTYPLPGKESYSADFLSGAQRLENGNTLICFGPSGRLVEVTEGGETVWEYLNPFAGNAPNPAGDPPYSIFRATQIPCDHPAIADRLVAKPEGSYNQRIPIRREKN